MAAFHRCSGGALHQHRAEHETEVVTAEARARRRQRLEVEVVDQPQTHRNDADGVHRHMQVRVWRGYEVLRAVVADGECSDTVDKFPVVAGKSLPPR